MAMNVTNRGELGGNSCVQEKVPTPPVPEPRKLRRPKGRDMRAFLLHGQGKNQRQIADELGCDQATVSRALALYHLWFGKSLPEDRGPMTSGDTLNVEMERHRIFLEHAQSLALTAYYRSCETLPISKTREKVYPEGRKAEGTPVTKTQTDKYDKTQNGHVASLNAAVRYSHERLVLAAGWVGPGNGCISLMQAMDPDERDRWQRMVKDRDARIDELTAERAAAQALPIASPAESASNCIKSSSEMHQNPPAEIVANTAEEIVYAELVEPGGPPLSQPSEVPQVHQTVVGRGAGPYLSLGRKVSAGGARLSLPEIQLATGQFGAGDGNSRSDQDVPPPVDGAGLPLHDQHRQQHSLRPRKPGWHRQRRHAAIAHCPARTGNTRVWLAEG